MKRKGGSNDRGQRPLSKRGGGGGTGGGSRGGGGRSGGGGGGSGGGGGGTGRPAFGPRSHSGRARPSNPMHYRGPKACPMCGAVVNDLKAHIRDRHDDAEGHPRD